MVVVLESWTLSHEDGFIQLFGSYLKSSEIQNHFRGLTVHLTNARTSQIDKYQDPSKSNKYQRNFCYTHLPQHTYSDERNENSLALYNNSFSTMRLDRLNMIIYFYSIYFTYDKHHLISLTLRNSDQIIHSQLIAKLPPNILYIYQGLSTIYPNRPLCILSCQTLIAILYLRTNFIDTPFTCLC